MPHFIFAHMSTGVAPVHEDDFSLVTSEEDDDTFSILTEAEDSLPEALPRPRVMQSEDDSVLSLAGQKVPPALAAFSIFSSTVSDNVAKRSGTFYSSTLILISSCFGASVLAVPWAIAQCGYALSIIALIICGMMTQWGANMLIECAAKLARGRDIAVSLKHVARKASERLAVIPEILVIIQCVGCAINVLVVVGFLLPRTFQDLGDLRRHVNTDTASDGAFEQAFMQDRIIWISVSLTAVLPLCFLRDITPLKFAGAASLFAVAFLMLTMAFMYAFPESSHVCSIYATTPCAEGVVAFESGAASVNGILQSIPIFFFSYSANFQVLSLHNALAHQSASTTERLPAVAITSAFIAYLVLPVHNALAHRSASTTKCSLAAAITLAFIAYLVGCLCAYLTFGTRSFANILGNYGNSIAIDLARLFLIISVALVFPLVLFTGRFSIMSVMGNERIKKLGPRKVFVVTTFLFITAAFGVAVATSHINLVFSVTGALATVPITLQLPGYYLTTLADPGPKGRWDRIEGWSAVAIGTAVTVLALYGTFSDP